MVGWPPLQWTYSTDQFLSLLYSHIEMETWQKIRTGVRVWRGEENFKAERISQRTDQKNRIRGKYFGHEPYYRQCHDFEDGSCALADAFHPRYSWRPCIFLFNRRGYCGPSRKHRWISFGLVCYNRSPLIGALRAIIWSILRHLWILRCDRVVVSHY
jgi:hypothetical protein